MTRSAGPLALDEIITPYGQDPNPPMPPDTRGINIAAVTGFTQGLFVQVPPWGGDMGIGDSVNVRLDANVVVSGFISNSNEIGNPVKLFIDSERLTTGTFYILDYTVTRLGTDPDPSPRTNIYVKLTRPGGRDENGSIPGHSELIMEIPEEVLLEGVDADTQEVPITILSYPEIDEGDRIFLYRGRLDEAVCSRAFGMTRPTAPLSPPELSFLTVDDAPHPPVNNLRVVGLAASSAKHATQECFHEKAIPLCQVRH